MSALPGLRSEEAAERRRRDGPNELEAQRGPGWLELITRPFRSPMVGLLALAGVVSAGLGEMVDAAAIGAIVLLNAAVGLVQEVRAERAVEALRAMTAPRARVLRNGTPRIIAASDVVVGDVLVLEPGDVVAADALVIEAVELQLDEATLTGESTPTRKKVERSAADAPLAERHDQVFMGTHVVGGHGEAEVRAIGMNTEMGRIADLLGAAGDRTTPLQERLAQVGRTLLWICLAVVLLVALLGAWRGWPAEEVAMVGLSLAVASIPEGLPAVVTIALALGVQRMARRHVLVRRLPSVETLGAATVVCTDKTGTLTTGRMTVREVVGERDVVLSTVVGVLDATEGAEQVGTPTELALLAAANEAGFTRSDVEARAPRVDEQPFSSATKWMWVSRADGQVYAKGAPDVLLEHCLADDADWPALIDQMASRGLRTLAVARGPSVDALSLIGLVGLADPPRETAMEAVERAHQAGIITVMITGDHPTTARAIADELGLAEPGASLTERVHARSTPDDKVRLVKTWRADGHIVAMTGDGVNDAPALREAHIGIAMGRTGTEVTREAADMILTDDDYAHIIDAVREGRGIDGNIRKTLVYLLGGNAGELAVMFVGVAIGLPTPLLPLHLLWINVVTDGLPALALVTDPPPDDVLQRPPRHPDAPVLGRVERRRILTVAALDAAVTLGVFAVALTRLDETTARTLAFTTLVISELFRSVPARHMTRASWRHGLPVNRLLWTVIVGTLGLQALLLLWPAAREVFHLALPPVEWLLLAIFAGLVPALGLELSKGRRS